MANNNRLCRPSSKASLRAAGKARSDAQRFVTVLTDHPSLTAVLRQVLELTQEADAHDPIKPGRPVDRTKILRLFDFVVAGSFRLGTVTDATGRPARIGTAEKGQLVQEAAVHLCLSPQQTRDLARQLADLAGSYNAGIIEPGN